MACATRQIAGLDGHAQSREAVGRREITAPDERGEQGLAGFRRALSGEPQRLRGGQRVVAVALPAILDAVARQLDIVVRRWREIDGEQRPLPALAQRLQPIDAQAVGQRAPRIAVDEHPDRFGRRVVDRQLELPVGDVGRQHVPRKLRRDGGEPRAVAAVESRLGREQIRIGLGRRRSREREGDEAGRDARGAKACCGRRTRWRNGGHRMDSGIPGPY